VSRWLVDAADPKPGQTILELAAGPADTGLMAAERVRPGGRAIITDNAPEMVAVARARAAELGIENVELREMEAEWIDLPAASVDGVLCRWGYMLLADPEAALRETRRVLRPGGRVALAAWDAREQNPWFTIAQDVLVAHGVVPEPAPGMPDGFAFARPGRIEELLGDAGFTDAVVDAVDFAFEPADLDAWWSHFTETSSRAAEGVAALPPAAHYELRDAFDAAYEPFVQEDGSLRLPARTLVATATA
jgi:SAM-dependent methyltransferase